MRHKEWHPSGVRNGILVGIVGLGLACGAAFAPAAPRPGLALTFSLGPPEGGRGTCIVGVDGRLLHKLTAGQDVHTTWSPDGKQLAFDRDVGRTDHLFHVFVAQADGRHARDLTPKSYASMPVWSPKGGWIAYVTGRPQQGGALMLMRPNGSQKHAVPHTRVGPHGTVSGPVWSPDGRRIVYGREDPDNGTAGAYVIDVDGSSQHLLAPPGGFATWSPDGRQVAFIGAKNHVWTAKPGGTDAVDLTPDSTAVDTEPAWSPDGRLIAFSRMPLGAVYTKATLWVIRPDGTGARRVVGPVPLGAHLPAWRRAAALPALRSGCR
jgi:Tol biopolymer transport system component